MTMMASVEIIGKEAELFTSYKMAEFDALPAPENVKFPKEK